MREVLLVLCLSFILFNTRGYSQSKIDSLQTRLGQTKATTEKAKITSAIAESFFISSRYDSLGKYSDMLLEYSKVLSDQRLMLLGQSFKAQSFARVDSAKFFNQSIEILTKCIDNNFAQGVAINCLGLGSRLMTLGKYQQANDYLFKGYSFIDVKANPELTGIKSDLIRTVSAVYHHQGKYTEALDYALQSSRLAEQSAVPMQILKSYLNLSGLYGEISSPQNGLGTIEDRSRYHVEAKKYMHLSYLFSLKNASQLTQGATAFNLGFLYAEDGKIDSALYYLTEAIRLGKATNFHELLSNAYRTKSTLLGKPDSVIFYLDKAYFHAQLAKNPISALATSLDKVKMLIRQKKWIESEKIVVGALKDAKSLNLLNDQRSAYLLLYEIKLYQREFEKALFFYKNYVSIKDSIINEKNLSRIEELKTKYETELKDSEIKSLAQASSLQILEIEQKNYLLLGVSAIGVLGAGFLFLYFRQRTFKQQQHALSIENRLLRFQLDPHFLSNALVSIQSFMLENNAQQASNYLSKFSRMMRQLLEFSREDLITIEQEIDLIRNYLDIQKLRFKSKFEYTIDVDQALAIADARISPMFTQPFIENAVEHGISQLEAGKINIVLRQQHNRLHIQIEDNGPGISKSSGSTGSLSTTIIQERIHLLNKSGKEQISLSIGRGKKGTGTLVQLYLPISS